MAQLQSTGITGSLTVTTGSATELLVTNTGVRIGNVVSDTHTVTGSLNISGSLGTVGTITATTLIVQTITSSVSTVTGSTKFGTLTSNTHQFTGSVDVSGSLNVNNNTLAVSTTVLTAAGRRRTTTSKSNSAYSVGTTIAIGKISNDGYGKTINIKLKCHFCGVIDVLEFTIPEITYVGSTTNWLEVPLTNASAGYGGTRSWAVDVYRQDIGSTSDELYIRARVRGGSICGSGTVYFTIEYDDDVTFTDLTNESSTSTTFNASTAPAGGAVSGWYGMQSFQFPVTQGHGWGTGSQGLFIQNGGNTGIGTDIPAAKLHVNSGFVRVTGTETDQYFLEGVRTGTSTTLRIYDNSSVVFYDSYNTMHFRANQNGGSGGTILFNGGSVGIGTTSPSHRLDVNGDITGRGAFNGFTGATQNLLIDWSAESQVTTLTATNLFFGTSATRRMTITSGGNVGIGTSTPNSTLQISKGGVTFQVTDTNKTANNTFSVYGLTQTSWAIATGNSGSFSGGEKIALSDNGYVGIGTLTPTGRLHVSQSGNGATSTLILSDNARQLKIGRDQIQSYDLGGSATTLYVNPESNIYMNNTAGITYFGGNVGIGTTNPLYKLHVVGNTNIVGDIYFNSTSTQRAVKKYASTVNLSSAAYTVICNVAGDSLASSVRISLQGTADNTVINVVADILANHSTDILITSQAGIYTVVTLRVISNNDEDFSIEATTNSATTCTTYVEVVPLGDETVTFGGAAQTGASLTHVCRPGINISATGGNDGNFAVSGLGYFGGSLGVGTYGPVAKLHIVGPTSSTSASAVPALGFSNSSSVALFTNGDPAYGTLFGTLSSGKGWIQQQRVDSGATAYDLLLQPNGGNVGIGTTNAVYKFYVNGDGGIGAAYFSSTDSTFNSTNTTINSTNITVGNNTTDNVYIGQSTLNVLGGNVGIGTTSPNGVLQVIANNNYSRFWSNNASGYTYVSLGRVGSELEFGVAGAADQFFTGTAAGDGAIKANGSSNKLHLGYSSGAPAMTINASNNVGINTTTPAEKLDVSGSVVIRANTGNSDLYFLAASRPSIYVNSTNIGLQVRSNGTGILQLNADNSGTGDIDMNSGLMRLDADLSRIGISTTSPAYKLDVWTAQSIRVVGSSTGYTQGSIIFQSSTADTPSARGLGVYTFNEGTDATWFYGNGYNAADSFVINRKSGSSYQDSTSAPGESSNWFLINNVGNVGIGTTSPGVKLQVSGAIRGGHFANSTTNTGEAWFGRASDRALGTMTFQLGGSSATGTGFEIVDRAWTKVMYYFSGEAPGSALTVNSSGNVGIASSAPAYKLDVAGDIRITGNIGIGNGTPSTYRVHSVGGPTRFNYGYSLGDDYSYTISRDVAAANGSYTEIGTIASSGASQYVTVEIFHHNCGTIEYSKFELIANYYTGGTTDWVQLPSRTQAHYAGGRNGVVVDARLASTGASIDLRLRSIGGACGTMGVTVKIKSTTALTESSGTGTGATVAGLLGFNLYEFPATTGRFNATSEGLFILGSGNVGIGSTSPGVKLDVNGNMKVGTIISTSDSTEQIVIRTSTNNDKQLVFGRLTDYAQIFAITQNVGYVPLVLQGGGGNVGIGTTTPNYKLRVQGDIYASSDVIAYSDARAKDNVKTVENALAKVTSLRGVTYTRNDIEDKSTKMGVIAQEVLKVLPEVVREGTDGYYSVAYGNMVGVLIEAIKELKAEIEELKRNK